MRNDKTLSGEVRVATITACTQTRRVRIMWVGKFAPDVRTASKQPRKTETK